MLSSSGAPQGRPVAPAGAECDAARLSAHCHGARRAALGALLAGVVLLHVGLLNGALAFAPRLIARPAGRIAAPRVPTMAVRLLMPEPDTPADTTVAVVVATDADADADAITPVAPVAPRRPRSAARRSVLPAPPRQDGPSGDGTVTPDARPDRTLAAAVDAAAPLPAMDDAAVAVRVALTADGDAAPFASRTLAATTAIPASPRPDAAPGTSDSVDVPVYHTHPPPAFTLTYALRRGMLSGTGELVWQPEGAHYEDRKSVV